MLTFPDFSAITNPEVWGFAITIALIASIASLLAIKAANELDPYKRKTKAALPEVNPAINGRSPTFFRESYLLSFV